jgi:hypothetical protein
MGPMFRKLRVLWLELDCSNLNPDLVQSIAHRKATDHRCPSHARYYDFERDNLPVMEEHAMSVNKGMNEEPKGYSIHTHPTDDGIAYGARALW